MLRQRRCCCCCQHIFPTQSTPFYGFTTVSIPLFILSEYFSLLNALGHICPAPPVPPSTDCPRCPTAYLLCLLLFYFARKKVAQTLRATDKPIRKQLPTHTHTRTHPHMLIELPATVRVAGKRSGALGLVCSAFVVANPTNAIGSAAFCSFPGSLLTLSALPRRFVQSLSVSLSISLRFVG